MNILSNREDTDECVNDTWYRAWNTIPPQKPKSLSAFFGRIVKNLSIDRYNANHTQKRYDGITALLSELEDCVASKSNTEQIVDKKLLSKTITDWLNSLPKEDRALFVRRYWFGESVGSLAKQFGVAENSMAQRILRMRKKLKSALEMEEIFL
jgi:RNA polymerase sigma-70 factor (ECF subfamily)